MKLILNFLAAFRRRHTYDLLRNPYIWFGFVWGLPVPICAVMLEFNILEGAAITYWELLKSRPVDFLFLAHPLIFGLVFGAMGTVRHLLGEHNEALIRELRDQAMTDPLTGAYNRRHVLEELLNHLKRSQRSFQPVGVVLFDLDDFKEVNERGGHLAGDLALQQVAGALRASSREGDLLGRYGGDEFLLVFLADLATAERYVERAKEAVREASGLTVSAGIATAPGDGQTPEELIRAADLRLARVKKDRRETRGYGRR